MSQAHTNTVELRDPVCGMTVSPDTAKHHSEHDGHDFYFCGAGCKTKFDNDPEGFETAKDPVCGMTVRRDRPKGMTRHEGKAQYFCSERCQHKFEENPERYLDPSEAPEPMPEGTKYTCPMDPEIVQEGPGTCPKCGMALEPMTPSLEDTGPSPELIDRHHHRRWQGERPNTAACVLGYL